MVHKIKSKDEMIDWGFDLTDVTSDNDFLELLKEFGFKEVSSKPLPDYREGRWTKGVTTFANPSGIRITVEHIGGTGEDKGTLGYIGMKSPKHTEAELKRFLARFRGSKPVEGTDRSKKVGITTYVKEENPYENPYIGVE